MNSRLKNLFARDSVMQRCPTCDELIDSDAINIKEGVALCPECGRLAKLSELRLSDRSIQDILDEPPTGCSIVETGFHTTVTASLRSVSGFLGTLCVALFWNGIVSIFVLVAAAGLYTNLIGPLPNWFPAPGVENGQPMMNDKPMGLGMTLFLCIFLIPFVTVGAGMVLAALLSLRGRIDVVVDGNRSYVATGFRLIRWKRKFDAKHVHQIALCNKKWQSDEGDNRQIELVADRTIKFGSMLSDIRMEWLVVVLKEILLKRADERRGYAVDNRSRFN